MRCAVADAHSTPTRRTARTGESIHTSRRRREEAERSTNHAHARCDSMLKIRLPRAGPPANRAQRVRVATYSRWHPFGASSTIGSTPSILTTILCTGLTKTRLNEGKPATRIPDGATWARCSAEAYCSSEVAHRFTSMTLTSLYPPPGECCCSNVSCPSSKLCSAHASENLRSVSS